MDKYVTFGYSVFLMYSIPSGSDGNIDINGGVSPKPHVVLPLVPSVLGYHKGEVGSMECYCSLVPGPTPHNGVSCGCSEGPASVRSPTSYTLPGHLHEPPPWPSHLPAGPQTRGETPSQSLRLLAPRSTSLTLTTWIKECDGNWVGNWIKEVRRKGQEKVCGGGTLRGCGVETASVGALGSHLLLTLIFPQCELSALEGMKACMTYFPRACGSLKVSICGHSSLYQHKPC